MKHINSKEDLQKEMVKITYTGYISNNFRIERTSNLLSDVFYKIIKVIDLGKKECKETTGFLFFKKEYTYMENQYKYEDVCYFDKDAMLIHIVNEDITKEFIKVIDDMVESEVQKNIKIEALFKE